MAAIAFIGLGNMGSPMARNLLSAGYHVNVYDINTDAARKLEKEGAKVASSLKEAVAGADTVITMLPAGQHVHDVYLGPKGQPEAGLFNLVSSGTFLIDSSTIDPATAKEVASHAQQHQLEFVDAPVSGGVAGAEAGTLTFIVGGTDSAFHRAEAVLQHVGKNIFHAGPAGAGQMAKICNNLMLAVQMAGACEAINLGMENGLNPKVLSDIMLQSSGRNWVLELYNPCPGVMDNAPASKGYQPGFMSKLMLKDLGLGMDAALQSQTSVPMGALARNLYAFHNANGNEQRDFSSLFEFYHGEVKQH
ncbi:3-hydroxyisobutyrate dehydrogenase [Photobacterium sp. WH77]|uniref:3-hydroxyisobutyrate dehydrogenase n=1 Tax=unclassified Photobacterium TaxID=2628852 RepID=UPI001EDA7010|nr:MULTISPECIES: 3-hydroxyisobutyrate dehydrogenase [unclassified Photobacterium]MCG2837328.1 3-hydroxyisobutyrate dehydrogenase [Photobacterium sp. WH77]MCG2844944.1 3-hydroxyisobutyrate dehydrogenase [Photobacterium sp. WH80]